MKRAIIIGASSGIGSELAKILSQNNYILGLTARRTEKLLELQEILPGKSYIRNIDITNNNDAKDKLIDLIEEMGGIDTIIISSGVGYTVPDLSWECEKETVKVNICGFMAMTNEALNFFIKQGVGHIVGISSVPSSKSTAEAPAYSASKAFVTNYLDGIREKVNSIGANITVTDIRPGLAKNKNGDGLTWALPPEKASLQIYRAIAKKKKHVYITKRWRIIEWILKFIPSSIYSKLKG